MEIARLRETSEIMKLYTDMAKEASRHSGGGFLVEEKRRERIFLCPPIKAGMSEDEGEIFSFEYANRHGINLGYPMGIMISQENLLSVTARPNYQYYFKRVKQGNAWKPAGLYAVAYGESEAAGSAEFFQQLLDFIRAQDLEVVGNAYGEYLLDELAVQEPEHRCGRIEIPVKPAVHK